MNNEVTIQSLGIVSMSYKGDYSSSTTYNRGSVVVYEGSSYVATRTTTGNLPTNTTYFQLIAQKPVKGVDYFTEEDVEAIVNEVTQDAESEFNQNVEEKTGEFNQNASNKTDTFNTNASSKTTDFNDNATSKTTEFNTNATNKTTAFNSNATDKTTSFDGNASDKTTAFNNNATSKTGDFDSNASSKTTAYNENHTSKLAEYNQNASDKLTAYNNNHTAKLSAYNENAEEKVEEFDEHVDELEERVEVLETVIDGLPKVEGEGTDIQLQNTIAGPLKSKLNPSELEQETTNGRNLLDSKLTNQTYRSVNISYDEKEQIITLNGNYDSSSTGEINLPQLSSNNIIVSANDTIYANVEYVSGSSTGHFKVRLANSGFNKMIDVDYPSRVSQSQSSNSVLSTTDDITLSNGRLYIYEGATFSNLKIKLYASIVSNVYEPYTGGIASPNPNYPQEIRRIWGDNSITVGNKNRLNLSNYLSITADSGVTLTNDATTGKVVLNGTTIRNTFITYKTQLFNSADIISLSANNPTTNSNVSIRLYDINSGAISSNVELDSVNKVDDNILLARSFDGFQIRIASGTTLNNFVLYPQIEKGSTATTYTSYQGKSYPLNLGVRNLFDKDNANVLNGVFINASNNTLADNANAKCIYISIKPNTIYTVSKIKGNRFEIGFSSSIPTTGTSLTGVIDDSTKKSLTSTSSSNSNYLIVYCYISSADTDTFEDIISTVQIEEGTKAHSYSQYGQEPVEYCKIGDYKDEFIINKGNNLLDESKLEVGTIDATTGQDSPNQKEFRTSGYIEVKSSTQYTLSNQNYLSYTHRGVFEYDENYNYIKRTNDQTVSKTVGYTFETTAQTKYVRIRYIVGSTISSIPTNMQLQLEEGTTATEYEPYGKDKWYIKKNIGKVVLDGSDTGIQAISSYDATALSNSYQASFSQMTTLKLDEKIVLSNYFDKAILSDRSTKTNIIYTFANDGVIRIANNISTTKEGFLAWLSAHNTIVYYVLASPEYILLNDTLQEQLTDIKKMLSYNEETNISQENNELSFNINASALLDINSILVNLETRIAELETA